MAAPASAVTITRAAELLGEDEELLSDMVDAIEPEDGCLWIHGTADQQTIAFTDRGLEYSWSINAGRYPRGPERMVTPRTLIVPLHPGPLSRR